MLCPVNDGRTGFISGGLCFKHTAIHYAQCNTMFMNNFSGLCFFVRYNEPFISTEEAGPLPWSPLDFYSSHNGEGWGEGCSAGCYRQRHCQITLNPTNWTFILWNGNIYGVTAVYIHTETSLSGQLKQPSVPLDPWQPLLVELSVAFIKRLWMLIQTSEKGQ